MPAHAELAAEFGICTKTLRRALEVLRSEGLVTVEGGRWTFACPLATIPHELSK
nr:GntR family transcriptional regulator [Streptomyces polyasparticus]